MTDREKELIFAYLDGELDSEGRKEAERLLASDPESRKLLERWKGVSETFLKPPQITASAQFADKVLSGLEDSSAKAFYEPSAWLWRWVAPAAAIAALVLALLPPERESAAVTTDEMLLAFLGPATPQEWTASSVKWPEAYLNRYLERTR